MLQSWDNVAIMHESFTVSSHAQKLVSRSQTLSQGKGGGGRGGRESGKVLYIELSQRLVYMRRDQSDCIFMALHSLRWCIRL